MTLSRPSRPEMQLTEVGPILNHAANTAFSDLPLPHFYGTYDREGTGLTDFEKFRIVIAETVDNFGRHKFLGSNVQNRIALGAINGLFHAQTLQGALTHFSIPNEVLGEGVKSGVIFPANALLTLFAERQNRNPGGSNASDLELPFSEISCILLNRNFQNSLVRLAKAPNGTYANASVEADKLGSSLIGQALKVTTVFNGLRLAAETKDVLKEKLEAKKEITRGCPVARATFPELGEHALTYARLLGIHPDVLRQQRTSAIRTGAHYLARVFDSVDQATMKTKQV